VLSLIGKLVVMLLTFASLRSRILFFTEIMIVIIPSTITLEIAEVGDFVIKTG
jgi:hypothetical protein